MSVIPRAFRPLRACLLGVALFALCPVYRAEEPDLSATIPSVTLQDGRVLQDVVIKSYGTKSVMVRHRDGVAQVPYDQFPSNLQPALLAKKPVPATTTEAADALQSHTQRPPTRASTPQTQKRPARGDVVVGRVIMHAGTRRVGISGLSVAAFDAGTFVDYDRDRRGRFSSEHEQVRRQLLGDTPGASPPTREQIEQFYLEEAESWKNLPTALDAMPTNEQGEFALVVPPGAKVVVFARIPPRPGHAERFHVWAVPAKPSEPVLLTTGNAYPILPLKPPSFE